MAIRVMSEVWDLDLPTGEKMVLLALADWSNDEGSCWPLRETIATRCSMTSRNVGRIIHKLESNKFLKRDNRGRSGTNYQLNIGMIFGQKKTEKMTPLNEIKEDICDTLSVNKGGHLEHPLSNKGGHLEHPLIEKRRTFATLKEDICDITIKNHQEPSLKTQTVNWSDQFKEVRHTDSGWFTTWWCYAFEIITGQKFIWGRGGKGGDSAIVITLFRSANLVDILERACCYMLTPESDRWPKGPPSLFGFSNSINQLAGKYDDATIERCIETGLHPDFSEFDQDIKNWQPWNDNQETHANG